MSTGHTVLKSLTVNSFGGITPDASVVVVFNHEYKGLLQASGDQETNKTSFLTAIEGLMGRVYTDYFINKETKSVDGTLEFIVDGITYRTRITKTSFKLEQYINVADKTKWISTGEEKTLIRKLLPFSTSPEPLTEMKGEQQIKWLKEVAGSNIDDTDLAKKEKIAYDKRTSENREVATLKRILLESPGNFKSEAKDILPTLEFQKTLEAVQGINLDEVINIQGEEVESIRKIERQVNKAKGELDLMDTQIVDKEKDILEKRKEIDRILLAITDRENEIVAIKERKIKGNEFIESNKDLSDKLLTANIKLEETKKTKLEKDKIITLNNTYEDYKKVFDKANKLTNEVDEIRAQRIQLAKTITPDIPGFEVRPGNIDEEGGLFYNEKNISVLSESERYGLVVKIWKHFGIKVLFIENITNFGSKAMEIIDMFAKEGGFVFATKMNRKQEKMSITFSLNE